MSNSSQPTDLSNILTVDNKNINDILKDCMITGSGTGCDTITLTSDSSLYTYNTTYDYGTVTLTSTGTSIGAGQSVYTISDHISVDSSQFKFNFPEEWIDSFPDWNRVKDMCEKYPGLKIAFDNFKVFYEMVKDDYDNPTPKK